MAVLSLVEVQNLTCERGGRRIFRDISFAAATGQVLTLEGPNGAGKSSALRILAGLLPPAAGDVRMQMSAGYAVTDAEERGKLTGWIGHNDGVKAQLTVLENAKFFAALYGARIDVAGVLDHVGLKRLSDLPSQYLSAGQRKRLGLARLILSTGRCGCWTSRSPRSMRPDGGSRPS